MEEQYPSLLARIQSSFIDLMLIIILMAVFTGIFDKLENVPDEARIAVFAGLFLLYEPLCMTFGCTLGNYLKGIRVRRESDSTKRINFFQALIRYPVKALLGWISFLTINTNPRRRAIHDMVSGSVMIRL